MTDKSLNSAKTINKSSQKIHYIVKIAILSAIAAVVSLISFPLPFAPSFYKFNLSDAVILMGGFAMGPLATIIMEVLKNLLNILMNGTTTAYIGELANFLQGCALVIPAALIYKYNKSLKGAIIGLVVGVVSLGLVGGITNYFLLIPAFSQFYHMPLEAIVGAGAKVNALVSTKLTLVLFAVIPFNMVRGIFCAAIAMLLYKRLSKILHF